MWSSNFISPSVQCRAMAFNSNNDGDDRCCSSQMAKNHALEMMGKQTMSELELVDNEMWRR